MPERREQQATVVTDVYLVRHGETQGYSSESGLTPLGSWQAHRRGQEIARRVRTGHRVAMAYAPTNRARQTAEHLRRGLLDNLELFGRKADVDEIVPMAEFGNFAVATPLRPARRHLGVPHLPSRDGALRADRARRAPGLARRGRPVLGGPTGRW